MSGAEHDARTKRTANLFAAAKRERMPNDAKEKLLTSLAVGAVATSGTAAATATSSTVRSAVRTKWMLGLFGGVVAIGACIYAAAHFRGATPVAVTVPTGRSELSIPSATPIPSETLAIPTTTAPAPLPLATPVVRPSAGPAPTVSATAADTWESEAEALATARGALRAGNTSEAQARLDKYFATFPHGHLQLEARVLRIRAYAKTDPARARREAEALRKAQPNSAYDDELKELAP